MAEGYATVRTTGLTVAALVRRVTAGADISSDRPDADSLRQRLDAWLAPALRCPDTGVPAPVLGEDWIAEGWSLLREFGSRATAVQRG